VWRYPIGAVAAAAAVLLAAGCGGKKSYTLPETRACLVAQPGVAVTRKVDFVASTALGGAVRADLPGTNAVTIAFALDKDETERIADAYRRFRGANIGIEDVLRPQRNAVLLWKEHPSPAQETLITDCLR
jgi:hypothetical protein